MGRDKFYSARAQRNEIIRKVVTQKKQGNDSPSLVNERQPWSDQSSDFEILSEDDAGAQKGKIYIFVTRLDECVGEERNGKKKNQGEGLTLWGENID